MQGDNAISLAGFRRASLLEADEPAAFEICNETGSAPVVLTCDHASPFIPRRLQGLGLDEACLSRHIAWDIGIAEVTRHLARRLDAVAVLSHFSRLVIDPNRSLEDPSSIVQLSDGVEVPGNQGLTPEDIALRVETFFTPYHEAVARAIDRRLDAGVVPVLISMHSFTPVMDGVERPWNIGILWNRDPRLPQPLIAKLRSLGLTVGDNEPYSGRGGHGYSAQRHGDGRGLANALVEVRQDLIDTHHGGEHWSALLGSVLAEVLNDPSLYAIWTDTETAAEERR